MTFINIYSQYDFEYNVMVCLSKSFIGSSQDKRIKGLLTTINLKGMAVVAAAQREKYKGPNIQINAKKN